MPRTYPTLVDIHRESLAKYADRPSIGVKVDGVYKFSTYAELGRMVDEARGGLAALGVAKGDRVAVIADNCVPWAVSAFAVYGLGALYVPMYEAQLPHEWAYIIGDSEAKVVLAGSSSIAEKLKPHLGELSSVKHVVVLRPNGRAVDGTIDFEELKAKGREKPAPVAAVVPEDLATLIYTSGTTGQPKGVMLTHSNIASNIVSLQETFPLDPNGETSLAFLPWAHCFGQVCELYLGLATGGCAALAESPATILVNLAEVKPTVLFSVPRVWNKVYSNLNKRMRDAGGIKLRLFEKALAVAERREALAEQGQSSWWVNLQFRILDKLVFAKIRAALGGRLKYAISGAAALSPEVAKFISRVGITVSEGYGLTETSPVATNNVPGKGRIGTVGTTIPDVTVKIAPVADAPDGQGEIVIYGPNVMKGYYKLEDETKAVLLADGGFRTGDLGFLDDDGYLHITGRVKEQYKLENGKYVAPAPLEEQLKLSPYMAQVFIYGANKPHNVALVVLNGENMPDWARENGLAGKSLDELARETKVRDLIRSEIRKYAADFKGYERIANFSVLSEEFSSENGMLTPTLKIKRTIVLERFKSDLESLYAETVSV